MAKSQGAHILVFPFPAQGHMLPLLDLAHQLSLRGLSITVAVTPKNLPILSPLLSASPSVQPLVLPFPSHPSIPPGVENAKDLSPSSFLLLNHALSALHAPLLNWAQSIPNPISAIFSDFFLGWTLQLADHLSVPRLVFSPSGAVTISIIHCLWREMPTRGGSDDPDFPISFPAIPNSPIYPWYQLSPLDRSYVEVDPVSEFTREGFLANIRSWAFVFNSFSDLEGVYLDHLRRDLGHERVWAVGPLIPVDGTAGRSGPSSVPAGELMTWLDGLAEGSVVYICFGSQAELAPPQAAALAAGLERSGVHFVWCMRGATEMPEGFEEWVKERGVVIRGWAPQVAVLSHRAVGSFLTHCGWNSVMEGIAAGVVMLTWPMRADQFIDARLLVEEAGVGVRVCEGADAVPDPDELARVVAESVEGNRPERRRARELKRKAVEAVEDGGSACKEFGSLVDALNNLKSLLS